MAWPLRLKLIAGCLLLEFQVGIIHSAPGEGIVAPEYRTVRVMMNIEGVAQRSTAQKARVRRPGDSPSTARGDPRPHEVGPDRQPGVWRPQAVQLRALGVDRPVRACGPLQQLCL